MHFDLGVLGALGLLLPVRDADGSIVVLENNGWPVLLVPELF